MGKTTQTFIRQTAFRFSTGWNPVRDFELTQNGYKIAREWQREAFQKLVGNPLVSVYGPPATGKGIFICMMAAEELRKDPNLRVIIAAPQRMITKDIREQHFGLPSTNEKIDWCPTYLNDTKENRLPNREAVKAFLTQPRINGDINSGALITSHQTLTQCFKEYPELFRNVLVVFDEQHHIKYAENGDQYEANELGEVVRRMLRIQPQTNNRILLTTATPFRGDRYPIIPENLQKLFVEYEHPYDKAWSDFAPLENFGIDFILYKEPTYRKCLTQLIGNDFQRCIVFVPNVNSRYSVGDKYQDVLEIFKCISGEKKLQWKKDSELPFVDLVKKGNKWLRIIDLVDEDYRSEKVDYISKDHDADKPGNIDVIVALGMMKEGANWRWAEKEYIIGNRGSLREFVQMVGRLFRSAQVKENGEVVYAKKSVSTYYLLPFCENVEDDEYQDNLNDYLKATIASLLLIKVYTPTLIETEVEKDNPTDPTGKRKKRVSYIGMEVPDPDKQERLLEEARDAIIKFSRDNGIEVNVKNNDINITPEQREQLKTSLDEVFDNFEINNHRDEIKDEIFRWFALASRIALLDTEGMNVKDIAIDLVSIHPCCFAIKYASNVLGTNTFREYREAVDRSEEVWKDKLNDWLEYRKLGLID